MLSNHNTFNYVQYHDVARNARNLLLRRIPTLRSIDRHSLTILQKENLIFERFKMGTQPQIDIEQAQEVDEGKPRKTCCQKVSGCVKNCCLVVLTTFFFLLGLLLFGAAL